MRGHSYHKVDGPLEVILKLMYGPEGDTVGGQQFWDAVDATTLVLMSLDDYPKRLRSKGRPATSQAVGDMPQFNLLVPDEEILDMVTDPDREDFRPAWLRERDASLMRAQARR
jgi:hypothetical protein